MALTTPAQKPRGAHRKMRSLGFAAADPSPLDACMGACAASVVADVMGGETSRGARRGAGRAVPPV